MLNEREIIILEKLLEDSNINLLEICKYFNVSKRTIQYNMNNINYYLSKKGYLKIGIKNGNILLSSKTELETFLDEMKCKEYINKEDRMTLIYLYAIFNDKGLNISNLAKDISVSRNTLKSDMSLLDGEKFEYVHSKGYFLAWPNSKKIEFLDEIYQKKSLQKHIQKVIDRETMTKVENFFKEISSEIMLNINDEIYQKLIITIYIMIKFSEKSKRSNKFSIEEEKEKIRRVFNKFFGNHPSCEKISEILIGLSINPNLESWLDESFLIKKMIKVVSDNIRIDLTEDKILFDFLLSHIKVSIYRLKKGIKLKNLVYQQLIVEDDQLLPLIKHTCIEIEEIFDIKFTDIEISLLAYHFKASIERMNTFNRKKVILVCGLGYGTSRILEFNLKEKFDIDIVDVLPSYMIDRINTDSVDYILSTIDLEDVEYVKINPLLKVEDYEKLDNLGIKRRKDKVIIDELLDDIEEYIEDKSKVKNILLSKYSNILVETIKSESELIKSLNTESVIFLDKLDSWEKALDILGKNLEKKGSITKEYTEEMKKMVKKLGPYILINDGIAIPHAKLENSVFKTDASLLIIKDGVLFDNNKKAFILLCFSSKDNSSHLDLLGDFYKLILNESFLEDMLKIQGYDELITYFRKNVGEK